VRRSPRRFIAAVVTAAALLFTGIAAPAFAADGDELFISEYIEGSSLNKALEIYNPTDAAVALTGYELQMYFNGATTSALAIPLTGTVAPGDVYVVAQASANTAILAQADQISTANWFNGDDVVVLVKSGAVIDSLGQIGSDPGTEWGTGLTSTSDNTLRRIANFCGGDATATDSFDPAVQWAGFAIDAFDGLGTHSCGEVPPAPIADCSADIFTIGSVQGTGVTSPLVGQTVRVEGTVVGDFQAAGGLSGYFLQNVGDAVDGDPVTSDGISVFASGAALDVSVGQVVHVVGAVGEFASAGGSLTQITAIDAAICGDGVLPSPVEVTLPAGADVYEPIEGMYVTFPQSLSILEYFEFGRFGSIDVGLDRQMTPTAVVEPGDPAKQLAVKNATERITLDDGRGSQNPDPAIHPNGEIFTLENSFRGGDELANITGVLDYRFGGWTVQPTAAADYTPVNLRPDVPQVGGDITVASFNVLNYFTTIDPTPTNSNDDDLTRGADTNEEFDRQEAKIVSALAAINADVFGLIEIENKVDEAGVPVVATLAAALNEKLGADVYDYIDTGVIGTDAITTALIYKTATVEPLGGFAVLDSTVDSDFADINRPALAQTFAQVGGSEPVTVVVNHLKSKGSDCNALGDPDTGDGSGNCNLTRAAAATALAEWLASDPTRQGAGRELIIGDLNSYDKEQPIDVLRSAGYTDLLFEFQGEFAYSYVFDGQLGYLDYALAGADLFGDVTGAEVWRINADEPSLIDYDMSFKQPAQDALFAPDPYRSSDHDPVVVGLELTPPDTTPPTLTLSASPASLFPPSGKSRTVTIEIEAVDDSGEVEVAFVSAEATGNKKAAVTKLTDTTFSVTAVVGAVYTFTYEATDAAGNATEAKTEVQVKR
jgi:predicted extracellular nuclease